MGNKMAAKNNHKVKTAERLVKLETICQYTKESIDKLENNISKIMAAVNEIQDQVTTNKTRLALWGALGGIIGGGIITLIVMLIVRAL